MYLSCPATTSFPAICWQTIQLVYFCTKNKVVVAVVVVVVVVVEGKQKCGGGAGRRKTIEM